MELVIDAVGCGPLLHWQSFNNWNDVPVSLAASGGGIIQWTGKGSQSLDAQRTPLVPCSHGQTVSTVKQLTSLQPYYPGAPGYSSVLPKDFWRGQPPLLDADYSSSPRRSFLFGTGDTIDVLSDSPNLVTDGIFKTYPRPILKFGTWTAGEWLEAGVMVFSLCSFSVL